MSRLIKDHVTFGQIQGSITDYTRRYDSLLVCKEGIREHTRGNINSGRYQAYFGFLACQMSKWRLLQSVCNIELLETRVSQG